MILTSTSNFPTISITTTTSKITNHLHNDVDQTDSLVGMKSSYHEDNNRINQQDDFNKKSRELSYYRMIDNSFEDALSSSYSFDDDDETNIIQLEIFMDDSYDIENDKSDNSMIINRSLSFDDYIDDDHIEYSNITKRYVDDVVKAKVHDALVLPIVSSTKKQKRVQFGNVTIREYSLTVGAYTNAAQNSCPIQLNWEYSPELSVSCDEYQSMRINSSNVYSLSINQRRERIAAVQDVSIDHVKNDEYEISAYIFLNEYTEPDDNDLYGMCRMILD